MSGTASRSADAPDRISVVTGAAGGIGRATVNALLARGDRVIAFDVDPSPFVQSDHLTPLAGDATRAADVETLLHTAVALGGLHVLINLVGSPCTGRFEALTLDDWRTGFELNLTSVWLVTRKLLPLLRATAGDRVIVNLSSTLARVSDPDTIAYGAFKAALEHLSRTLAIDLAADHIRVVAVAPGPVSGTRSDQQWSEEQFGRLNPLGRFATPNEVASVIAFVSSTAASFVTGCVYAVDGGDSALGVGWGAPRRLGPLS
ncbi:MAG TPA: SDR family oxidoreductase [Chloroflexota bacterium]|nr:SDR family oxidoreductase [Chloroflexota bacterium]